RKAIVTMIVGIGAIALYSQALADDKPAILVSLVQLIANPAAFDQKRVQVQGFVVLKFEHQAIYLSEADAKHAITRNGVWMDVSDALNANRSSVHQRYALVEGTFNARRGGHLSLFSGVIEDISRLERLD